jgi:hypothetical protein
MTTSRLGDEVYRYVAVEGRDRRFTAVSAYREKHPEGASA